MYNGQATPSRFHFVMYLSDYNNFEFTSDARLVDGELTLEESTSATVEFTVEANPNATGTPTITRQDGMPVTTGSVVVTDSSVQFLQALRDDAGVYILALEHEAGTITGEIELVVECT